MIVYLFKLCPNESVAITYTLHIHYIYITYILHFHLDPFFFTIIMKLSRFGMECSISEFH